MNSPWQYFTMDELTCKCGCGRMEMNNQFMVKVVTMRRALGFSFPVTSAYRCPEHNNNVSGTGMSGPHTTGHAIDIAVNRQQAHKFLRLAFNSGMTGIGVSQKGENRFIHIDDIQSDMRPWMWSY